MADIEELEEDGYPLSPKRFAREVNEKVAKLMEHLASKNVLERDADFARGQIYAYRLALEIFINKKK